MKIASFNINGIKARAGALTRWLDDASPDLLVMQEIKSTDETFPRDLIEERGYNLHTHGQKGFNGVAVASKLPLEDVTCGLPGDDDDVQARWIEATVTGDSHALRVCGLYLPNGNPVELDTQGQPVAGGKYAYKLAWMARMEARLRDLLAQEMPLAVMGDYNIIPQAEDAARPDAWVDDALFRLPSRMAYRRIMHLGFTDAFRAINQAPGQYTFWDYQAGAWSRNDGIRIDHILLNAHAADLLRDCRIDTETRAGEKPSDHVPIWAELAV
ncbi:exodeoxyribonuclease III [Roseinatronobacter sp.]|uniref:exodeoxyribonuclease III n=1 Tax=Roseinatronobacter sp. TaxID=1945755 RepID=UPI003F6EF19B